MTKKRRVKNFRDPIFIRIVLFGHSTIRWRLKAVRAVELTEAFVLTGYGSRNSKRARSYGRPNNRYLQGATSTVHGATSFRNGKTVPYAFRNACMDLKRNITMVHHSPALVNRRRATVISFYRKNPRVEKTKGKKLTRPDWESGCPFWALIYPLTAESCQSRRTHRGHRFDRLWLP